MNTSVVAHCPGCRAIVNVTWKVCPSCLTPIDARSCSTPLAAFALGARITWEGADLTLRHGMVDFLHTDTDGLTWVFVTWPDGWSAVNMKQIRKVEAS